MYERLNHRLLPRKYFVKRVFRHLVLAMGLGGMALLVGMVGYHTFEPLSWLDAFVNAAMILSGMGPVSAMHSAGAKLFAGLYALFSGVFFIGVAGVVVAPFAHRLLHRFHMDDESESASDS